MCKLGQVSFILNKLKTGKNYIYLFYWNINDGWTEQLPRPNIIQALPTQINPDGIIYPRTPQTYKTHDSEYVVEWYNRPTMMLFMSGTDNTIQLYLPYHLYIPSALRPGMFMYYCCWVLCTADNEYTLILSAYYGMYFMVFFWIHMNEAGQYFLEI